MSAPVYSTRFIATAVGSGQVYTVPVGKVAIVSCIDVVWPEGDTSTVFFGLASGAAWVATGEGGDTLTWQGWRGHQVLAAGETFNPFPIGTSGAYVTASGYLLSAS